MLNAQNARHAKEWIVYPKPFLVFTPEASTIIFLIDIYLGFRKQCLHRTGKGMNKKTGLSDPKRIPS